MHKDILVIDDNPDIRLLVSNILKEKNFAVRSAANYDQAVFEINKKIPDLAIVDIKLDKADKDGIDLLKLLIKKDKHTPVIMISGHATVQIAVEAIRLGAYEFIEKPFSTEKILSIRPPINPTHKLPNDIKLNDKTNTPTILALNLSST